MASKSSDKPTGTTRKMRDNQGLTQSEAARRAGLSRSTVSRYEGGKRTSSTSREKMVKGLIFGLIPGADKESR